MKLILCDNKKITTYQLKNNVEDTLTIEYFFDDNEIYEIISLKEFNNKWQIEETPNIKFVGETKSLYDIYDKVQIQFLSMNIIVDLYFLPILEEYTDITVNKIDKITIGSSNESNIVLTNYKDNINYIEIIKEEENYNIKSVSDTPVYLDNYIIKEKKLNIGSIIMVNGVKIIWMGTFFKVSYFGSRLKFNNLSYYVKPNINITYTKPTEFERNLKCYTDGQLFFHTPRLQSIISEENMRIDLPPEESKTEKMPFYITMGSSAIMCLTSCTTILSAVRSFRAGGDRLTILTQLLISLSMLVVSVLLPILTNNWQKRQEKKRNNLRQKKYTEYLTNKKEKIEKIIKQQEETLHDNNLSLEEIQKRITSGKDNIWIREITDEDFLDIRLGSGDLPASINIDRLEERFSLYEDDLRSQAIELSTSQKKLSNVPITISMAKNKIVTFILGLTQKQKYIESLILQLMYYYSPNDLKLIILTTKENEENWEYLKYTPYMWSEKKDKRFYATNDVECLQISSYLDKIYEERLQGIEQKTKEENKVSDDKNNLYKNYNEYYLIITDNFKEINNLPIVDRILNSNLNIGFSLLIFGDNIKSLPSKLNKFIDVKNNISGIYSKNLKNNDKSQFHSEYISDLKIDHYSEIISNIPISSKTSGYNLPANLTFLELFHTGKISHLNIAKKWIENDPTVSLFAPIGYKENGKIIGLDLHEKAHGPHGLIAGSTGSGKSEFIITYILSMAINYSPKEVQFILIDYKGGGLAGAFENRVKGIKIPHLVGTITNLDKSEMNRTLVSIKSELERRQMRFNEARELLSEGTIDIYKYQKLYREGKIKETMPHLFVVCDEFAELKQQQPEFMEELISTSRIGRSLGVHLILATQKPSGVVDDQIWSNARFKVCLKVQTEGDSVEMLKRKDAATIKETGRFYLQVGNNELFEYGQAAWAGAKYTPVEHLRNKIDDSLNFIANDGTIVKTINEITQNDINEVEHGEQLTNIVNYLYELAIKENLEFTSLWLPSLQKNIYLSNIIKKYNFIAYRNNIQAVIGEYDKPSNQEQGICLLDLNCKNTIIFGVANSGKENLISNVIYSLSVYHSPNEVVFYILDFGSESLNVFNNFPHVGDFISSSSLDKISAEFEMLEKEMKKRKELFNEYGGSYENYCKNSGKSIPMIITILNLYESFMENCYILEEHLNKLLREGSKYGIVFITTAISASSVRGTVLENYSNKIILQSNESFDYHFILNAPIGMVPYRTFGRGLTKVDNQICEFQSAIIHDDSKINEYIKNTGRQLQEHYKFKAINVKLLPKEIKLNSMFKFAKQINKIPLGYTRDTVEIYYCDFLQNKITNIIGNNVTNEIGFMCSIIDLIDSIKDVKLNIFDFITCVKTDGSASYYNINFLNPFKKILENNTKAPTINIIIGIGNIFDIFDNEEQQLFDSIMNNIDKLNNNYFIIFDNNDRYSKIKEKTWFNQINKNYIWHGKYIDSQNIFDISHISNYDIDENMKDIVYVIENQKYTVIKGINGSDVN